MKNIVRFNFEDKKFYLKFFENGCSATEIISRLKTMDVVGHPSIMQFEYECRMFIIGFVMKLKKRMILSNELH